MLETALHLEGYLVTKAYSDAEVRVVLSALRPDLVLLNPRFSYENILPMLQKTPVIVISAKADAQKNMELPGDTADYVTRPFPVKELLVQITAALRESSIVEDDVLIHDNIRLDLSAHRVTVKEQEVRLTRTEYAILKLLLQNRPQTVRKSTILDQISGDTPDCTESSLKMHVSNLRRKLREISGKDYIEAVWGIGFKIREG